MEAIIIYFLSTFLLYDTVLVTGDTVVYIKPQTCLVSESWYHSTRMPCSPELPSSPPPVIILRLYQSTRMPQFFFVFLHKSILSAIFSLFWKNVDYFLALSLCLYSVGSSLSGFPWLRPDAPRKDSCQCSSH